MKISNSGLLMEDGGSCMPCTSEDEKRITMELMTAAESNLKEGNLYYVLSNRWFAGWQQYVGQESDESPMDQHFTDSQHCNIFSSKKADRPGPIDNSDLILKESNCEDDDFELRTLEEGLDYVLVPHAVWQKLLEWYKGGPALPRELISQGDFCKQFNVEVYLLRLKLTDSRDDSQSIIRLSKKASIQELYERVCTVRGIKQEKVQIWDFFNKQKHSILATSNHTLEESNLQMDQDILLEVQLEGDIESGLAMGSMKNDLALVPIRAPGSPLTIAGGPILSNYYPNDFPSSLYRGSTVTSTSADLKDGFDSIGAPVKLDRKGLAGLQNLGNTCFMNSAIQCLVHTPPLVEFFLQDYTDKINRDNPLGMHGELALAFGELLRKLWSSGQTAVAPRTFKGKLARFAPQFSGYNQHDSQELLAFLLDGLHEDLNRVKQKPYIETKDSGARLDEVVAEECWMNHRARNDSLIVDVCQGQYKSTLVCPVCGKVSVTFDPFMYLSLPLPSTATRTMTVTVFYGDGTGLPMPYTVTVSRLGYCKDLVCALGAACCLNMDESLLLTEVHQNCIHRYLENPSELLSCIRDDEHIIAYRLPKNHSGLTKVELLHRCLESSKLLGAPLLAYIDEPRTAADIYSAVERVISPLRRKPFIGSAKVHGGKTNGIVSEAVDKQVEKCIMDAGTQNHSGEASSGIFPFQLSITDERGLGAKVIEKEFQLKPGQTTRVVLDWSKREHELYDASYLKDLPEVCKAGFSVKKTRQEDISLFSCLETFLREEPLGPDDMWYCPNCKEHRQATKKLDLWRLPDILVFHLKRFSYSRYFKNKLDAFVSFPIHDLDLSKYVKCKDVALKSHVYQLYAISNHYGGLGGGHYSAYAKLIDENRWYHFDDSHVSPVSEEDVRSPAAYVLFYQTKAAAGSIDQTCFPSPPLYGG